MGHNRLGYDTNAGMSFDVTHDGANEAWGMREARRNTGTAASRDDRIMQAHAFAPGEDDKWLAGKHAPGDGAAFGEGVGRGDHNAETFLVQHNGPQAKRFMGHDGASDCGGKAA